MSVKRRTVQFISGIMMAMALSACLRASMADPADLRTTAPAAALAPTQIERSHLSPSPISGSPVIATFTPGPAPIATIAPTPIPDNFSPRGMRNGEKLYMDPEGWFSVYIPADREAGETPDSFSGKDGSVILQTMFESPQAGHEHALSTFEEMKLTLSGSRTPSRAWRRRCLCDHHRF